MCRCLHTFHPRLPRAGMYATVDEHLPPEAIAYKMQDPQWCLKQAGRVGPHCKTLIDILFADRVLDNLRAAQGIVGLAKRFGNTRLEAACKRALDYDNPRYRTVKTILQKGLDQVPEPEPAGEELGAAYTGDGRFGRNVRSLLIQ